MFAVKVIRGPCAAKLFSEMSWLGATLCGGDVHQISANNFQLVTAFKSKPRFCRGLVMQNFSFGKVTGPIVCIGQVDDVALTQTISGDDFRDKWLGH